MSTTTTTTAPAATYQPTPLIRAAGVVAAANAVLVLLSARYGRTWPRWFAAVEMLGVAAVALVPTDAPWASQRWVRPAGIASVVLLSVGFFLGVCAGTAASTAPDVTDAAAFLMELTALVPLAFAFAVRYGTRSAWTSNG